MVFTSPHPYLSGYPLSLLDTWITGFLSSFLDMDSTTPSTSASSSATPPADPSALRSCLQCHCRMSSLKYDLHTICTQCRSVACSLDTRCPECQNWSAELMSEYIKHKTSLAGKCRKKPVTSASSTPAVASSPGFGSLLDYRLLVTILSLGRLFCLI